VSVTLEWTQDVLRSLRLKLAALFPIERDARALLQDAGLDSAYVDLSGSPVSRWFEALSEARKHPGKLDQILAAAHKQYPNDDFLDSMVRGTLRLIPTPSVGHWRGGSARLEKIIGLESTLVPISFLERGLERARAVARIRVPGPLGTGFGTGFLIREDLLLTNNHVVASATEARRAIADFNYQKTTSGQFATVRSLSLNPDIAFETSVDRDWTVVGVDGRPGDAYGVISLQKTRVERDEFVQIIQHPDGGEKQLAYRMNVVAYADANVVQYLTDTLPGSSGAPVFNREWQVVALHHAGGQIPEPTDPSSAFLRNQGIRIDAVIDDLHARGVL
jgi:V8-like Glu-specific endopeptidase